MKTTYIEALLKDYRPDFGTVQLVTNGVNVTTPFAEDIQRFLAEQVAGQFTAVRAYGDVNVRLNKEVDTVCAECGSPWFYTRVIEDMLSYIDPCHKKAKTTKLVERKVYVLCVHCGTPRPNTKVQRFPEVKA